MAFAENIALFFDTENGFAKQATWQSTSVGGIFDDAYVDALGMASSGPRFTCPTGSVGGVVQGQTIVIDAITYRIVGVEPDGTGVTVLQLARN
jgi:hypothetical protein